MSASKPTFLSAPLDTLQYVNERQRCAEAVRLKSPAAISLARSLARKYPKVADAHDLLSKAVRTTPPSEEMLTHAFLAAQLDPGNARYLLRLGGIYQELRLHHKAIEPLGRATEIDPENYHPWALLGKCYQDLALADKAAQCFETALALEHPPKVHSTIKMFLAHCYSSANNNNLALPLYLQLQTAKGETGHLALLHTARVTDQEGAAQVEKQLLAAIARPDVEAKLKAKMLLAAGKLRDRAGDHGAAFELWSRARALQKTHGWHLRDHQQILEEQRKFYNAESFRQLREHGHPSDAPVIVAGMPRSGTTLVEQIIGAHPEAGGVGEFEYWAQLNKHLSQTLAQGDAQQMLRSRSVRESLKPLAQEVLDIWQTIASAAPKRIVEKLPHNFIHLGFQRLLFPNARFLHIRRHPLDAFISTYQADFVEGHGYAFDQVEYAKEYLFQEEFMANWKSQFPEQIMTIHYEELAQDPMAIAPRIIEFCGLDWHERCLEFYRSAKVVKTLSTSQVRQPVYATSIQRWKKYEKQLGPIMSAFESAGFSYPTFSKGV